MSRYNMDPSRGGIKQDSAKTQWHLLPDEFLEGTVAVLEVGAKKYSEWNWANGMPYSRVYNSLRRHLNAFWQGEDLDPETKLPHVDHIICNAIFLAYFFKRYPDLDDRPIHLGSTARQAVPQDLPSTTPQAATPSDLAQIQALGAAMHSARQNEQLQSQSRPLGPLTLKEWNPPPPGSVLFEIPGCAVNEVPESSEGPETAFVPDRDGRTVGLPQEGEPLYKNSRRLRRMNPERGQPPTD